MSHRSYWTYRTDRTDRATHESAADGPLVQRRLLLAAPILDARHGPAGQFADAVVGVLDGVLQLRQCCRRRAAELAELTNRLAAAAHRSVAVLHNAHQGDHGVGADVA